MNTGIFLPPGRIWLGGTVAELLARLGTRIVFSPTADDRTIQQWWQADVDALAVLTPHTSEDLVWQTERLRRAGITAFIHLQPGKT